MTDESLSLLFVEDNPVTSASLGKAFSRRGFEVVHAATLEEGLEAVQKSKKFDCLLCDFDRKGENGLLVAKAFADKFPSSPIAIFTGHKDLLQRKDVQVFFHQNPFPKKLKYLYKPIDRTDIFQWFSEVKMAAKNQRR